jgi:hypothetical protein
MTITNDDVKRVAYKLAEEIIADYGYLDEKLLGNRMENTTGIRPGIQIIPGGSFEVSGFTQRDTMRVLENDEAMIDYRRELRRMTADELKAEQENVKPDPAKSTAAINEANARKSEIYSAFVSLIHGLPDIVCAQKISEIISGGPNNSFLKSTQRNKERELQDKRVREWKESHQDIALPEEIEDEGDVIDDDLYGEEDDDDGDHPEPEQWSYDAGDANNPWYLVWRGGNSLDVISMIFPSKKSGLEYLVPIIGVPVAEDGNIVKWNFDAENASDKKVAKLFTDWYFGCGAPSFPSLVRAKFGKPLVGFDLD